MQRADAETCRRYNRAHGVSGEVEAAAAKFEANIERIGRYLLDAWADGESVDLEGSSLAMDMSRRG